MRDPIGLIANLARHTNRLYMWTHYYDDSLQNNPHLKDRYRVHTPAETEGFSSHCTGRIISIVWGLQVSAVEARSSATGSAGPTC